MAGPSPFEAPHIILPSSQHTHTVIAIHGRGSQGPEFAEDLFEQKTSAGLNLREHFPGWRWVFPSSQERYSTVFQEELDEWFDIYSLTDPSKREELQVEGLRDSINHIQSIIVHETEVICSSRVILLGLSQGSATGLLTLLASQLSLGAFVGLSGWFPFHAHIGEIMKDRLEAQMQGLATFFQTTFDVGTLGTTGEEHRLVTPGSHNARKRLLQTPVFLGHTADDEVVDFKLGREARDCLEAMGLVVSWKEHEDGGHLAFLETQGLDDVVEFLAKEVRDRQ